MMHGHDDSRWCNPSDNESFDSILSRAMSRRQILKGGLGVSLAAIFGAPLAGCASGGSGGFEQASPKFAAIPVSSADTVTVPPGYRATVLYAWGDPVSAGPAFAQDASNTAAEQLLQSGMHHDGMHYFPLPVGSTNSVGGLIAVNHEYTDDGLLHVGGMVPWTAEKVAKSQAAHGVSVIEVQLAGGAWSVKRPSTFARRITATTAMDVTGPAAGSDRLRTAADATGRAVLGTINNCAHGFTPWGTFLTCEENFNGYFAKAAGITSEESRYGLSATGFGYRWHEFDERFDASRHPNEFNRFGWVVEIDPYDPSSKPAKRTALGRFKHESAAVTLAPDNTVVAYLGDDERFEYIYKFVSAGKFNPDNRTANFGLLDAGTLFVAKFNADGTGQWLPLVQGQGGLTAAAGFASQADVLVLARKAADTVGATKMDRPEWIAVHPDTKEVYCTLTNNSQRGTGTRPAVDAANPRAANVYGHIIRWREAGKDAKATTFAWDIFVQAGDPAQADPAKKGNIKGDAFGSPDGLWFDPSGILWIQTDVSTSVLGRGDYANLGNNQMLAADPVTGEVRRFLTGPKGCEVTGVVTTPDRKTMFVGIQHPGEPSSERSDPDNPKAISSWPDGPAGGRPRAGIVVVQKADGGSIGS